MLIRLVAPLLLVVLVAACGGGGAGSTSKPSADLGQAPASQGAGAASPGGNAKVDCATIKTAAQDLLMVQLLAQLRDPEAVAQIKGKQLGNLDLDKFLASMHQLHALDGFSSVLGDPKAAIAFYEDAAKSAQALFAMDPVTQAAIDTYNQKIGTIAQFLGHQAAISAAMGAAGC